MSYHNKWEWFYFPLKDKRFSLDDSLTLNSQ